MRTITDPAVVRKLLDLEDTTTGVLKAERVVEEASSPESCLHDYFTWDNTKAANEYRLQEARSLIQSVAVYREVNDTKEPVRIFVSLTPDRHEPGGAYRRLETVLTVPVQRDQLLADALAELEHFQRKYAQYQYLAQFKPLRGVFKEVEKVTKKQPQTEAPSSRKRKDTA